MNKFDLNNKNAIITGGAQGFGLDIAKRFLQSGAKVTIWDSDENELKLIKMDPGISVPLHSHNGKEYILVIDGSFCDEYGEYKKGDMQINDQKIKHHPIASNKNGCICLSITERDVVFFGKLGSALNLFTFIKSFFK